MDTSSAPNGLQKTLKSLARPVTLLELATRQQRSKGAIRHEIDRLVADGQVICDTSQRAYTYQIKPDYSRWQPRHFPPRENGKHGRISIYCHTCQRRHMLRRVHGRYVQHCQSVEWRVFTEDELR